MASGVYPWMVIVIFTRELLVTGIRAELESSGIKFGAKLAGKTKVLLQVIVVPSILILVWLDPNTPGREWITYVRDFILWATVIFTVGSGIPYFLSAVQLFLASGHKQIPSKAIETLFQHFNATFQKELDQKPKSKRMSAAATPISSAAAEVSVMTFNLRYANAADGENAWFEPGNRCDVALALLRRHRPAVLCVQEGLPSQLRCISTRLGDLYPGPPVGRDRRGDSWFALPPVCRLLPNCGTTAAAAPPTTKADGKNANKNKNNKSKSKTGAANPNNGTGTANKSGGDEHCAIFHDPSRVVLRAHGDFWLSETPDVPGSSSWKSALPRMVTWARFDAVEAEGPDSNSGLPRSHVPAAGFCVWNTHLDHKSALARENGMRVVVQMMQQVPECRDCVNILVGDMNTIKTREAVFPFLCTEGFVDTWTEAQRREDNGCKFSTFHGWRPSLEPSSRQENDGSQFIDWVVYRDPPVSANDEDSSTSASSNKTTATSASTPRADSASSSSSASAPTTGGGTATSRTVVERISRACIITDHEGTRFPSDHFPVMSSFVLHVFLQ
ncbi:endonuclease/exonuclease/phosphatase family protein [Pelomyxa schiedti]|nr:endonuclease/exonuclease/phosphatase family protein [Pelomyxa schiedti]